MIELYNEDLSKYTTVRIGGTAEKMLIPESIDDLAEIIRKKTTKYFIGGGSNLLINNRSFDVVVNLRSFNTGIESLEPGLYKVGGSVRLQKLIKQINEDGYGGIEYLCNVPGLVGGAVVMNAGTGKKENKYISDYIISVDIVEEGNILTLEKDQCEFSYRNSYFREHPDCIVVSVLLQFPEMSQEESEKAKNEKMRFYKERQDPSHPNFGSVFREKNVRIMSLVKKLKIGKKVHFSGKTANWILNEGGDFDDAMKAIRKVESLHKLAGKKCSREVIVWE